MNPTQSLDIISEMVAASRTNISKSSFYYLVWGWLVLIGALANYALLRWSLVDRPDLVWLVLIPIGMVSSIVYGYRHRDQERSTRTFMDRAMMHVWIGFFGPLLLALFFGYSGNWNAAYALFIASYGWMTISMGGILNFRPLVVGGALNMPLALLAYVVSPINSFLVLALAILISYIIPGTMLKRAD